jgi:hypothetical protein
LQDSFSAHHTNARRDVELKATRPMNPKSQLLLDVEQSSLGANDASHHSGDGDLARESCEVAVSQLDAVAFNETSRGALRLL